MEEWKQIKDYPNYSISNYGNIRNDKTMTVVKSFPRKNRSGESYLRFFRRGGKAINVHKLVATSWVENLDPTNNTQIDHIDRNTFNNHFSNLRWVTPSNNSFNRGRRKRIKGAYECKNKWRCVINHKATGKIHLGYFKTEREAGLAYNNYIIQNNLGEFCELNQL